MVLAPTILAILLAALFRESGGNGTKLFDCEEKIYFKIYYLYC